MSVQITNELINTCLLGMGEGFVCLGKTNLVKLIKKESSSC